VEVGQVEVGVVVYVGSQAQGGVEIGPVRAAGHGKLGNEEAASGAEGIETGAEGAVGAFGGVEKVNFVVAIEEA
jgi:hypothetical protein